MIELRTLGTAEVTLADGTPVHAVPGQPKRFALLAYLALARPSGFHSRDALLALFWPESDTERARTALRQALHWLRRWLGDGVPARRGPDEVGIAPGALHCDAVEFERALDEGRHADALALYRGDLLPGLFVADAPGVERWVEAERRRLRGRAADAAWRLAADAEAVGDAAGAAGWARRAAALQPDDEDSLRRLVSLLDRVGDPAAALRAYDDFAARTAAELDLAPSARTRLLVDSIRARLDAEPPAPAPSPSPPPAEAPAVAVAPPAAAPADPAEPVESLAESVGQTDPTPGRRRLPRWARRAAVAAGLALAAAGAFALFRVVSPTRVAPAYARGETRVAVLPFAVRGGPEWAYLGDGMVDLLSAKLDGAGTLRAVDPRALLASADDGAAGDPDEGRRIARRFDAGMYVLGSVVAGGGRVQLRASLYEAGGEPAAQATVEGSADELFTLVDRLAARLLAERERGPGARLDALAARTTTSLPALKAYLRGQAALRSGEYDEAVAAFGRAVAEDSAFALAWYRLSVAEDFQVGRVGTAARQARRHAGRLGSYDRLLLDAWLAYWEQRYADAERLYRAAVSARPDDVEAWSQLGEALFHGGPQRGSPAEEARPAFERAVALEPDNGNALVHLARLAAMRRERTAVDRLTRRILALGPEGDRALEALALRALLLSDGDAAARVVAALRREGDYRVWVTVWRAMAASGNPVGIRPMAAVLTEPVRSPLARAQGHLLLAHAEASRGRWRAARTELAAAEPLDSVVARQGRILFATLPWLPAPPAELRALEAGVAGWTAGAPWVSPSPHPTAEIAAGAPPPPSPALRLYYLGLLRARAGDAAGARAHAAALDRLPATPWLGMPPEALAAGVRAHVAWTAGDGAAGLAALEGAWQGYAPGNEVNPHLYGGAHPRFLRAELLRLARRDREAAEWYASVPEDLDQEIVYLAPALLHRAELLDRQGRRREAAVLYARFVALWREADPELQPEVARAAQRLKRLRGPWRMFAGAPELPARLWERAGADVSGSR
ncbi:MAG: BTAD domain-containing putative transcriptional regulator [Gemmatimonadota bacterium]